jgi:hypothetical protein
MKKWLASLTFGLLSCLTVYGQNNPVTNEYRVTIFPFHPITKNITGFGYLGYVNNPQSELFNLLPGIPWHLLHH